MTRRFGLIVTDASPLITLAAGEALECLTMPGVSVVIPDMVYFEVTQNLAKIGADDIAQRARAHRGQVEIAPTTVFGEYQILRAANSRTRSKGRGEQAALEVLNAAVAEDLQIEATLLYEDNDVRKQSFLRGLPERIMALSTGDLLFELESAGLIQSSDHILDLAAAKDRNVEASTDAAIGRRGTLATSGAIDATGCSGLKPWPSFYGRTRNVSCTFACL